MEQSKAKLREAKLREILWEYEEPLITQLIGEIESLYKPEPSEGELILDEEIYQAGIEGSKPENRYNGYEGMTALEFSIAYSVAKAQLRKLWLVVEKWAKKNGYVKLADILTELNTLPSKDAQQFAIAVSEWMMNKEQEAKR